MLPLQRICLYVIFFFYKNVCFIITCLYSILYLGFTHSTMCIDILYTTFSLATTDMLDNHNHKKAIQELDRILKKNKYLTCAKVSIITINITTIITTIIIIIIIIIDGSVITTLTHLTSTPGSESYCPNSCWSNNSS